MIKEPVFRYIPDRATIQRLLMRVSNMKDDLADEIINLVRRAKKKTKVHKHKGTYRMRAWLVPEGKGTTGGGSSRPFGRQGA